jgi:hypothetical protein
MILTTKYLINNLFFTIVFTFNKIFHFSGSAVPQNLTLKYTFLFKIRIKIELFV